MFKLLWSAFKYGVLLPILLVVLYFGLMQPLSKRLSLMELSETAVDGTSAFSAFGDFLAERITLYRNYYNIWLPEDKHIQPVKKEDDKSI
ncbi:MAG: hypothetical protein ACPGN3_08460 [Opitutales bacterium]